MKILLFVTHCLKQSPDPKTAEKAVMWPAKADMVKEHAEEVIKSIETIKYDIRNNENDKILSDENIGNLYDQLQNYKVSMLATDSEAKVEFSTIFCIDTDINGKEKVNRILSNHLEVHHQLLYQRTGGTVPRLGESKCPKKVY